MKQKGLPGLEKKTKKVYPNQYICTENQVNSIQR